MAAQEDVHQLTRDIQSICNGNGVSVQTMTNALAFVYLLNENHYPLPFALDGHVEVRFVWPRYRCSVLFRTQDTENVCVIVTQGIRHQMSLDTVNWTNVLQSLQFVTCLKPLK